MDDQSVLAAGGKPSTWLPPGRLVEHHAYIILTTSKNKKLVFDLLLTILRIVKITYKKYVIFYQKHF